MGRFKRTKVDEFGCINWQDKRQLRKAHFAIEFNRWFSIIVAVIIVVCIRIILSMNIGI